MKMEEINDLDSLGRITGIGRVISTTRLNIGNPDVTKYLIDSENGKYLQKIYQKRLPEHLPFVRYLSEKQFPCSRLMLPREGIVLFQGMPSSVFSFVPGSKKEYLSLEDITSAARLLARMHILGKEYSNKTDEPSRGMVHGDFHQENLIFNEERVSLIDFDSLKYADLVSDIGTFIFYYLLKRRGSPCLRQQQVFLEDYNSARLIGSADLTRIPEEIIKNGRLFIDYSELRHSQGRINNARLQRRKNLVKKLNSTVTKIRGFYQKLSRRI